MTISVEQDSMTVADAYYDVMNQSYGYVSHSFNQFILVDEDGRIVAIDVAAQGARVEGVCGVGPPEAGLTQPLPVLGVFDYPDDFLAVVLLHVVLAENQA